MTDEKCLEVLDRYEARLAGLVARRTVHVPRLQEEHLLNMIPKMRMFLKEGRREKFMRWLGFLQGAFWVLGEFTIEAMKEHNCP